jgi:DNA-directed RNA polymerase specialized sigma24 family protein
VDTLDTGIFARGRPLSGTPGADAASAVTAVYEQHAVSMIRIALIMLGDRATAEDVVQDAFFGLYRRWAISEDHRRILAGVRLLPGRQREALVCRFFLGLSEDETARAMGVSKGTVKSATSRAVSALRRMLMEGKC